MLRLNRLGLFPQVGVFLVISIVFIAFFLMMQTASNKQTLAGYINFANPLVILGLFGVIGVSICAYFIHKRQ